MSGFDFGNEVLEAAKMCQRSQHTGKGCNHSCRGCHWNIHRYVSMTPSQELALTNYAMRETAKSMREERERKWDNFRRSIYPTLSKLCLIAAVLVVVSRCTQRTAQYRSTGSLAYVTADVNMRSGPSMENRVVTVLRKGAKVTVLGESGHWLKVSQSGTVGYASRNYLQWEGSSAQRVSTWGDYNYAIRKSSSLYRRVDVNRDGLYNCIDAAVTFYKYYGDKSRVRIVQNRNPNINFYHLFNQVYVDGRWVDVEPQTVDGGGMRAEWGNEYDPAYNKDETEYWSQFAR